MNKIKFIYIFMIAVSLLFLTGCPPMPDPEMMKLDFELNEEQTAYSVVGIGDCTSIMITIPSVYNDLPVESISPGAFSNCDEIVNVIVPNSVTSIGRSAFYGCTNLVSIELPFVGAELNGIENTHFGYIFAPLVSDAGTYHDNTYLNPSLVTVYITNLTNIDASAFSNCSYLETIYLGSGVMNIGDSAFLNCTSLRNIDLGYNLRTIGDDAFAGCINLTSIEIPDDVTNIGKGIFAGCDNLSNIVVKSGNVTFDSRDNCNAIIETKTGTLVAGCKNTVIHGSILVIRDEAFAGCTNLTSIEIPRSVRTIGTRAFAGCSSLTSITIPRSVTSIADSIFYGCKNLSKIVVDTQNLIYDSRDNCNAIIEKSSNTLIVGCKSTVIPNDVTTIASYAFYNCDGLTTIKIPASVTSIGERAFYGCNDLEEIIISNSVIEIGKYAILGSNNLTIYCEATSKPNGWHYHWNANDQLVVWGFKEEAK